MSADARPLTATHRPPATTSPDWVALRADTPLEVISRSELRGRGWHRDQVARQVAQGRWATVGTRTIALHTGPIGAEALRWRALWEVGPTRAVLDGVSALQAGGLTGYDDAHVHVSVLHTASARRVDGVRVHKLARRVPGEIALTGIPRTRPAVASVRAAHWARSDRQAALLLVLPVQQRLVRGPDLLAAVADVNGRSRRAFIRTIAADIADGAQALGELDFATMCRRRGLPAPDRQVVRRGPRGRIYLDCRWNARRLVVEIDGSHHRIGLAVADDHLRQNTVTLAGDTVLRMDLIGLRLHAGAFMDQVVLGLRPGGSGSR